MLPLLLKEHHNEKKIERSTHKILYEHHTLSASSMSRGVAFIADIASANATKSERNRVAAHQRTMANFGGKVMQNCYAIEPLLLIYEGNGRGGI